MRDMWAATPLKDGDRVIVNPKSSAILVTASGCATPVGPGTTMITATLLNKLDKCGASGIPENYTAQEAKPVTEAQCRAAGGQIQDGKCGMLSQEAPGAEAAGTNWVPIIGAVGIVAAGGIAIGLSRQSVSP